MKVKELIKELEKLSPEAKVYYWTKSWYNIEIDNVSQFAWDVLLEKQ